LTAILEQFDFFALALSVAAAAVVGLRFLHMMQLESYQTPMYLKWLRKNGFKDQLPLLLVFLICLLLDGALLFVSRSMGASLPVKTFLLGRAVVRLLYVGLVVFIAITWKRQPKKKPLAMTARAKRLLTALVVICVPVCGYSLVIKTFGVVTPAQYLLLRAGMYLPALLLPYLVALANVVMLPVENAVKRHYFNDAKRMLEGRPDLVRVGVTGSFGKTSAKFILGAMLSEKYNVLVPPHSYNTPMGITRVVRERLMADHQVFVAEMGARYTGDIEELCELVRPGIGLITSVGKQHLETFGSLENIINTKYELIASLPADGAAFFNGDNEICRTMYARCPLKKKFLFGTEGDDLAMRAIRMSAGPKGSTFTLLSSSGDAVECTTPLLGRHNILNITGCAAVARYLGVSMEQIAEAVSKLEPVEYRLQLIPGPVTVINDGFNSNPEGAKVAMEVIRSFPGRKIVVTPGMVELGDEEEALNEAFGKDIAISADFAVLIGEKRTEPIKRGLVNAGFPQESIFTVNTLAQATEVLGHLTQPGDVVIFENDLPDNYTE
jgi:UDP-N-acetylmuramoyl-tripeptide--D-alanyl-D-alanine ligase